METRYRVLYCYPEAACAENWLHDCMCEVLRAIHTRVQASQTPLAWPDILPAPYRAKLRKRTGLRDRLISYEAAFLALSLEEQVQVMQALNNQNQIAMLLSGARSCDSLADLPQPIHQPARDLFSYAFGLLTDFGVRDGHYNLIYGVVPSHVCPFCGCEYFDAPGAPREALDHYLPASKYPFAATNLRNLAPMGTKCNSRYKLAQDILFNDDGSRRKVFDPYNHTGVKICLENSQPFAGEGGRIPRWIIEFDGNPEEVNTWDCVFHIRERYERDVLNPDFISWLRHFGAWCRAGKAVLFSDDDVVSALACYGSYLEAMELNDRAFLKAAVFRMLRIHCEQGNNRLISFIKRVAHG